MFFEDGKKYLVMGGSLMNKIAIGKRSEFYLWAKLLKSEIDVFPSLVDDKGIDAIVGYSSRYYEVQVKSAQNWTGQRGISFEKLQSNRRRLFIIYNYSKDELRFFTSAQILKEKAWSKSIKFDWAQIPLSKTLLKKYSKNDYDGFIRFLKKKG